MLSRNRQEEALKSLCWLRGWVEPEAVQEEFNDLQRCRIAAQQCYDCEKLNEKCEHPTPTIRDKIRDLFRRRTLRPFILIGSLFFFSAFCGISPYRPFLVQILYSHNSPIDPNEVIVWMGYIGFAANVLLTIVIRSLGKRQIYLWSMGLVVLSLFGIGKNLFYFVNCVNFKWKLIVNFLFAGIYGFMYLPLDKTSFDVNPNPTQLQQNPTAIHYLPIVIFNVLQFLGKINSSKIIRIQFY